MPAGRRKFAHTQGVVAQVKWVPDTSAGLNYTGVYANGADDVIMRMSETGMLHEKSEGLMPSVAFKILRDGTSSDNVVAMPSFSGSGSWNFLETGMRTRVTPFELGSCDDLTIRKKLVEGSKWPYSCGIGHIAQNFPNGQSLTTGSANTPYELTFEATSDWVNQFG